MLKGTWKPMRCSRSTRVSPGGARASTELYLLFALAIMSLAFLSFLVNFAGLCWTSLSVYLPFL